MPTYEYVCDACHGEFEIFQSITASPVRKCPECGRLKMKRKISAGSGIIFRGSGFYETDYRSESYKSGQRKDTSTVDSAAKSSDSKSKSSSTDKAKSSDSSSAKTDSSSAKSGKKSRKAS